MKTTNRTRATGVKPNVTSQTMSLQDFDELAASQAIQVEHQTVPGFLRRIPHKWHLNDINRFGSEIGRAADAMQLVFMTAVDRSLGVLRVFPVPLLERVYTIQAPQFGWPALAPLLEDGSRAKREELRRNERLVHELEDLISATDEPKVVEAASILLSSVTASLTTLKAALAAPAQGA
jgi:hypothetical protein